ncbi:MAG: hypothetical protein H7Y04_02215, partial [Verrucomicrobia bacterium]|nr:hypothetical protein [Cytophagales bacterium]
EPNQLKQLILEQTRKNSTELRDYGLALRNLINYQPANGQRVPALRNRVTEASQVQDDKEFSNINLGRLERFVKSRLANERVYAAKMLRKATNDTNVDMLLMLMRDKNDDVKSVAIHTARKVQHPATWSLLLDELAHYHHRNEAAAALIEAGDAVVDMLEIHFHRVNQLQQVQLTIIQIFGKIGTTKATDMLWRKIDFPDKNIIEQTLVALSYCNFVAKGVKARVVTHLLEAEIGHTSWNQAALEEVAPLPINEPLQVALREELSYNFDRIFRLLSLIYDPQSIGLVRENVESDTSEGKVYAVELMDVFISKNLKSILFPLLEEVSVSERINALQAYFPRKKYDSNEILEQIINADFNHLNRWTKSCALYASAFNVNAQVSKNLMAQLFNPDKLICETAAFAIRRKDKVTYAQVSNRLNEYTKRNLDRIFEPIVLEKNKEYQGAKIISQVEKVLFLKQIKDFEDIPGLILAETMEYLKTLKLRSGEQIRMDSETNYALYVIAKGEIMLLGKEEEVYVVRENEIFGDFITQNTNISIEYIRATQDTIIYTLSKEHIFALIAKYQQLAKDFIQISQNRTLSSHLFQ